MKKTKTTALIGLAFLLAASPQEGLEVLISRARSVIQDPHFSRDAITSSLSDALGAAQPVLLRPPASFDIHLPHPDVHHGRHPDGAGWDVRCRQSGSECRDPTCLDISFFMVLTS